MGAGRPALHDGAGGDDAAEGQARGDALGEQDDVGGDAERLGGEEASGAACTALDLVERKQDPVAVAALPEPLQPGDQRDHVAALAEHRLDDHHPDVGPR